MDIMSKYMSLEVKGVVQVLYVWIDGSGRTLRCKTKTVYKEPKVLTLELFMEWISMTDSALLDLNQPQNSYENRTQTTYLIFGLNTYSLNCTERTYILTGNFLILILIY